MAHKITPVWFFVGLLLGIYGVLIFVSGIANWSNTNTVLGEYHAPVWWGAIMTVVGAIYVIAFRPRRTE